MATAQKSQPKEGLTLEVRRTFAFPRERVFAAWTERDQLERWMCKDAVDHVVIHRQQDIRTGGRYLLEVHDPVNKAVYFGSGVYREITPPEKMVFTWRWTKDKPDGEQLHPDSPETVVTVEFFARGTSTEVVLTHGLFGTQKDYDDHRQGWNGCFDVLEMSLREFGTK